MSSEETNKEKLQAIKTACQEFCLRRNCLDCKFKNFQGANSFTNCHIFILSTMDIINEPEKKSEIISDKLKDKPKDTIESKACQKVLGELEGLTYYQGIAVLEVAKEALFENKKTLEKDRENND